MLLSESHTIFFEFGFQYCQVAFVEYIEYNDIRLTLFLLIVLILSCLKIQI